MIRVVNVPELRVQVGAWRDAGLRVGFVPTMGNLHEGHLELVRLARRHAERVICSIFVNPTQFGPGEDFERYPRTPEQDAASLRREGVDILFMPTLEQMYPFGVAGATEVLVPGLAEMLCGAARPGHFQGVATVVTRLLNMTTPDVAVFGQKDYQQLMIIRRLVRDLSMPVEIVAAPTSREADGLARSSRNQYLTAEQRTRAPLLYAALMEVAAGLTAGDCDAEGLCRAARRSLETAGLEAEYVECRDAETLGPASSSHRPLVVLGAVRLGRARLIDNVVLANP